MSNSMYNVIVAKAARHGITKKSDIAKFIGVEPNRFSNWRARGVPSSYIPEIASRFDVSVETLINEANDFDDSVPISSLVKPSVNFKDPKRLAYMRAMNNVEPASDPSRTQVPIISWVQAGTALEAIDNLQPGDAEGWVTTQKKPREHTYALRISGDSMSPDFRPGMILVVEPTMCAEPGDFVIAKNDGHEATFKQYVVDGGKHFLKPLNPQYPVISMEGYEIIGVVTEAKHLLK